MTTHDVGTQNQIGLIAAVWRYRWLTLGLALIGGLLATYVTLSANEAAEAKAVVALTDPRGNSIFRQGSSANIDLTRYTAERAAFAESEKVLALAVQALGGDATAETVDKQVEVKPNPDTSILSITAQAPTSEEAIEIADAVANAYQELSLEETKAKGALALSGLDAQRQEALAIIRNPSASAAEVAAGTQTLSTVNARAAEIESSAELFGNGVAFADPARPVKKSGLTALVRNGVAGAMIGLVIGAAIAWVLADRQQKRQRIEDEAGPSPDDGPLDEDADARLRAVGGTPRARTPRPPGAPGPGSRRPRRPETLL